MTEISPTLPAQSARVDGVHQVSSGNARGDFDGANAHDGHVDAHFARKTLRDQAGVAKFRHEAIAVLFQVQDTQLKVLALERAHPPFAGKLALPSGPLEVGELLGAAVARYLKAKVGIEHVAYMEQLETRSDQSRDPFERTVATAYVALIPWDVTPDIPQHGRWIPALEVSQMAFDHADLVVSGVSRLQAKLSYSNIAYALAPERFTIAQLRCAYQAVLGYQVSATNLKRILMRRNQLVDVHQKAHSGAEGGRPAQMFRFADQHLTITDPFATLKP